MPCVRLYAFCLMSGFFDYLENGKTLVDYLEGFPSVTKENAIAVLELAKSIITSEKKLSLVDEDTDC